MELMIDTEFKALIPALIGEELAGLEDSLKSFGCQDSIKVWNGTIVDGHNRYAICSEQGIEFQITELLFDNRNDAKVWIIQNQFGRRNLNLYQRGKLALVLKPLIAEKAKDKQRLSKGRGQKGSQNSVNLKTIDTQKELAKSARVSHDTIAKIEKIEQEATPEQKEELETGEASVSRVYNELRLATEPTKPHVSHNSGNNEWYTPEQYIEAARKVMGSIDLDPASSTLANTVVKAERIYTIEDDGLRLDWNGNIWLNPPYDSRLVKEFTDKLIVELVAEHIESAIVLVNNATETQWFRKLVDVGDAVCFTTGRVRFWGADGSAGAPLQGQTFIYFGDDVEDFWDEFKQFGWIATI